MEGGRSTDSRERTTCDPGSRTRYVDVTAVMLGHGLLEAMFHSLMRERVRRRSVCTSADSQAMQPQADQGHGQGGGQPTGHRKMR